MRLTRELAQRVAAAAGPLDLIGIPDGRRWATGADHDAIIDKLCDDRPDGADVWVFAYGSLIWKPAFEHDDHVPARLHGWHRSFCLGWDRRFRGSLDRPGLMLALDHGGSCHGIAYRVKRSAVRKNMRKLLRREMRLLPHPFPPRWVRLRTKTGSLDAITFAIDRNSGLYVGDLAEEETADMLATAIGELGSMAEYLHNTVSHLAEFGIHDRRLWRLQHMVAERIEKAHPE